VTQRQFLFIFPFLQTNITSQTWPRKVGGAGVDLNTSAHTPLHGPPPGELIGKLSVPFQKSNDDSNRLSDCWTVINKVTTRCCRLALRRGRKWLEWKREVEWNHLWMIQRTCWVRAAAAGECSSWTPPSSDECRAHHRHEVDSDPRHPPPDNNIHRHR